MLIKLNKCLLYLLLFFCFALALAYGKIHISIRNILSKRKVGGGCVNRKLGFNNARGCVGDVCMCVCVIGIDGNKMNLYDNVIRTRYLRYQIYGNYDTRESHFADLLSISVKYPGLCCQIERKLYRDAFWVDCESTVFFSNTFQMFEIGDFGLMRSL